MRIKKWVFSFGIFSALMSDPALADRRSYVLWGAGNDSCERFVSEQSQRTTRFDSELSWIAGFVSASNGELSDMMAKRNATMDLLKGADASALEKWLVNYCQENPSKNLSSAGNALTQSLLEGISVNRVVPKIKVKPRAKKPPRRYHSRRSDDLVTSPAR